ncbi:MAG: APC family permease [Pseudomonadota bacterium]
MEVSGARLKRRLGAGLLTLYGVGVMIGAGIYVLVGAVAGAAGTWAPMAFLAAGVVVLPTVLSYAELATRIPESAGEAAYLDAAFGARAWGRAMSLAAGIAVATVGIISAAVVLQGGAGYLRALIDLPSAAMIVLMGVALGAAAVIGVLESLSLAAVATVIEVGGLAIVAVVGLSAEMPATMPDDASLPPSIGSFGAAMLLAFFAFVGFEDMVNMAEETRDPGHAMPRAILAALVIAATIYALVSWAAVSAVPPGDLASSDRPLALVYERATGQGAGFLAVIAVVAALNGVLAQIVMAARVLFGLGRRHAPFRVFHAAHPRFGTPVAATMLSTALVLLLAVTLPLVALAEAVSLLLLVIFVAVNAALIALKRAGGGAAFTVPLAVPVAGAVLSIGTLVWSLM